MLKFDASDFKEKTDKLVEQLEEAAEDMAYAGGHRIWEKSQDLVAVDTGLLKSTGYLATKERGVRTTVEIGYGGAIQGYEDDYVWYAKIQERQSKFLSSSVSPEIFKAGVRQAFKMFLSSPSEKRERKANPPYASQKNPDSAGLVIDKKKQDSGLVEEI